jgi:hypothetical protein
LSSSRRQVALHFPFPQPLSLLALMARELRVSRACECGHASNTHMARHMRTCVARPFALRAMQLAEENRGLCLEVSRLTAEIAELRRRPTTIVNNGVINVVAYGHEPKPDTRDVLPILRPPERSVTRYIEMKHFRNPSTANMRISNKRMRTMQVVEEDASRRLRWTEKDRKQMIDRMLEDNLEELIAAHGAERVASWKQWYHSCGLAQAGYEQTHTWKRVQEDIQNMLLSQKSSNVVSGMQAEPL